MPNVYRITTDSGPDASFMQPKGMPPNMYKNDYSSAGAVVREKTPIPRWSKPDIYLSSGLKKIIEVFWLAEDELAKKQNGTIFFKIVGINPNRTCNGYVPYKKYPPMIIHVESTIDPNIYLAFIVYSDEVVRLRLVINTETDSSKSLEITSVYSWKIDIFKQFEAKIMRSLFSSPHKETPLYKEDMDGIVRFVVNGFWP